MTRLTDDELMAAYRTPDVHNPLRAVADAQYRKDMADIEGTMRPDEVYADQMKAMHSTMEKLTAQLIAEAHQEPELLAALEAARIVAHEHPYENGSKRILQTRLSDYDAKHPGVT